MTTASLCDSVRASCEAMRKAAEKEDTTVAKAERALGQNKDDPSNIAMAEQAYQKKCEAMRGVLAPEIESVETKLAQAYENLEKEKDELKALDDEVTSLKKQKRQLKETLENEEKAAEAAKQEEAELDEQLAKARKTSPAFTSFEFKDSQGSMFTSFIDSKVKVMSAIEKNRVLLAHRTTPPKTGNRGFDVQRIDSSDLQQLAEDVKKWQEDEKPFIEDELKSLEGTRSSLVSSGWPEASADIGDVQSRFKELSEAMDKLDNDVQNELNNRQNKNGMIAKFMKGDAAVLQWCRQERTNLEAQTEPNHVQDFCITLVKNIPQTERSLSELCDSGETLLPDKVVERALVEVNEVWLNLQIYAYERLRHIMIEIHQKSKLEDEVRAFSNFSTKLKAFLEGALKVFQLPTDRESKKVVMPVMKQCEKLLQEFQSFALLSDHLSDFSLRMENLRDNYNVLRRTVFGKVTFLSTDRRTVSELSNQRKRAYRERIAEIKEWLSCHTEGETWSNLHGRVQSIKDVISEQLTKGADDDDEQEF